MLNKVTLIGNVGKDPEIRAMQSGDEMATLTLATSERWKDKDSGEKKEKIEWHRIVVFNKGLVGVIKQYVKKGSKLFVEGSLATRKWTDENGTDRYSTEINIRKMGGTILLLDKKGDSSSSNAPPAETYDNKIDNDIPF